VFDDNRFGISNLTRRESGGRCDNNFRRQKIGFAIRVRHMGMDSSFFA
jgi:hypothetical protein